MVDKMDSQVTLTTSDDPPVSLTVSRSALVTHSKVFADMLSLDLQSDDGDTSIPLAETDTELSPFLLMLQGREADLEEALSSQPRRVGWENFAKLADKYDSATARKVVEAKIWEVEARQESALFSFTLATIIGDESSIRFTAVRAVKFGDLSDPDFRAASEWKARLAFWRTLHVAKIFSTLATYTKDIPQDCCPTSKKENWTKLVAASFALYDPRNTPPLPISQGYNNSITLNGCSSCQKQLKAFAETFVLETSKWDAFPVHGLNFGIMGMNLLWKC